VAGFGDACGCSVARRDGELVAGEAARPQAGCVSDSRHLVVTAAGLPRCVVEIGCVVDEPVMGRPLGGILPKA
jgi:hypothetical protein